MNISLDNIVDEFKERIEKIKFMYQPYKVKSCSIEMKIVLENERPFNHKPTRLPENQRNHQDQGVDR